MAPSVPILPYWANTAISFSDAFLQWAEWMHLKGDDAPAVNSVSYGMDEVSVYFGSSTGASNMQRFDYEFAKLGVKGISVLVASGDTGASQGRGKATKLQCGFNPGWPASSRFVTAVGGTMWEQNQDTKMCGPTQEDLESGNFPKEVASTADGPNNCGLAVTSGGGFSSLTSTPLWQRENVNKYWQNHAKNLDRVPSTAHMTQILLSGDAQQYTSQGIHREGRGYPDIAMMSWNYETCMNGQCTPGTAGTSAAAPVAAGLISTLNSEMLKRNRARLGFLNPLLYKLHATRPDVFNDITEGNNRCMWAPLPCCEKGFDASPGWDPMTGLGSLNYGKLKDAVLDDCSLCADNATCDSSNECKCNDGFSGNGLQCESIAAANHTFSINNSFYGGHPHISAPGGCLIRCASDGLIPKPKPNDFGFIQCSCPEELPASKRSTGATVLTLTPGLGKDERYFPPTAKEYQCFEVNPLTLQAGETTVVRGTFANRDYYEGYYTAGGPGESFGSAVVTGYHAANENQAGNSPQDVKDSPIINNAVINYSSSFAFGLSVTGFASRQGHCSCLFPEPSECDCVIHLASGNGIVQPFEEVEDAATKCFWGGPSSRVATSTNGKFVSSDGSINQCSSGADTVYGSFTYVYSKDEANTKKLPWPYTAKGYEWGVVLPLMDGTPLIIGGSQQVTDGQNDGPLYSIMRKPYYSSEGQTNLAQFRSKEGSNWVSTKAYASSYTSVGNGKASAESCSQFIPQPLNLHFSSSSNADDDYYFCFAKNPFQLQAGERTDLHGTISKTTYFEGTVVKSQLQSSDNVTVSVTAFAPSTEKGAQATIKINPGKISMVLSRLSADSYEIEGTILQPFGSTCVNGNDNTCPTQQLSTRTGGLPFVTNMTEEQAMEQFCWMAPPKRAASAETASLDNWHGQFRSSAGEVSQCAPDSIISSLIKPPFSALSSYVYHYSQEECKQSEKQCPHTDSGFAVGRMMPAMDGSKIFSGFAYGTGDKLWYGILRKTIHFADGSVKLVEFKWAYDPATGVLKDPYANMYARVAVVSFPACQKFWDASLIAPAPPAPPALPASAPACNCSSQEKDTNGTNASSAAAAGTQSTSIPRDIAAIVGAVFAGLTCVLVSVLLCFSRPRAVENSQKSESNGPWSTNTNPIAGSSGEVELGPRSEPTPQRASRVSIAEY